MGLKYGIGNYVYENCSEFGGFKLKQVSVFTIKVKIAKCLYSRM